MTLRCTVTLGCYGNARVYGDAEVCGDAEVYGNARVYGNAEVCGDADYATAKGFGSCYRTKNVFPIKKWTGRREMWLLLWYIARI